MNRLPTRIDVAVGIQHNAHDIAFLGRFELHWNGLKEALHVAEWFYFVEMRDITVSAYMLHDMLVVGTLHQQYVAAQIQRTSILSRVATETSFSANTVGTMSPPLRTKRNKTPVSGLSPAAF